MSRFTATLARILEHRKLSKSGLARKIHVSPATVGDYLTEEIAVTAKNLAKIMRGIPDLEDQVMLLLAHLEDQTPAELRAAIVIERRRRLALNFVKEGGEPAWRTKTLALLDDLPTQQRDDMLRLLERLRDDTRLRDLLNRTLDYIADEDSRVRRKDRKHLRRGS